MGKDLNSLARRDKRAYARIVGESEGTEFLSLAVVGCASGGEIPTVDGMGSSVEATKNRCKLPVARPTACLVGNREWSVDSY